MIDYMDLKPYMDEAVLERAKEQKLTEEQVLRYLGVEVMVERVLFDYTVQEIDEWFAENHYKDKFMQKEFDSMYSYLNTYASYYIDIVGYATADVPESNSWVREMMELYDTDREAYYNELAKMGF